MRFIPVFSCVAVLGLVCATPFGAEAQAPYTISMRPQTFQSLPIGGGTATSHTPSGSSDEGTVAIQLPFTVRYFDQDKSSLTLSTNIAAAWGASSITWTNQILPSATAPNDVIAPWWDDNTCGVIKTQYLGSDPSRTFIAEWKCSGLSGGGPYEVQLWLFEGSSTIEFHYGTTPAGTISASMGIENSTGTIGYQVPSVATGLPCNNTCTGTDWRTNTVVTFSQGPELRLTNVQGAPESFAGVRMPVSATVTNNGGKAANDFTMRFWVSPTPSITAQSRELVTLDGDVRSLLSQQSTTFEANPRMPIDLEEGLYYIVAEADPHRQVPETNRGDNVAAYGPFSIGTKAANLAVSFVELGADVVAPGGRLEVSWLTENIGNLPAHKIGYEISISSQPVVTPSSVILGSGTMDTIELLKSVRWSDVVDIPAEMVAGRYYVGVALDPSRQIFEHDRSDNTNVSQPLLVGRGGLVILTEEVLPTAHANGHYSIRLDAFGGDGIVRWSMGDGSSLPPGLSLVEEASSVNQVATFLRGVPSTTGPYRFALVATSAGLVAAKSMSLTIERARFGIAIANESLAFAAFGFRYEERLAAFGGSPPYTWDVTHGELPMGVQLRSDGFLSGTPHQDGRFPLTLKVTDSDGLVGTRDLAVEVSAPSGLTCVTRELPPLPLGERVRALLVGAGGEKGNGGSYTWTTQNTLRLATRIGEKPTEFPNSPPPGIELKGGSVQGIPSEIGTYLWKLKLEDQQKVSRDCHVLVRVPEDRGLAVVTQGLPTAFAGRSYQVRLEAAGGDGNLTWSEYGTGRVLEDLGLSFDLSGLLVGTPSADFLDGETQKEFAVLVSVRDELNRVGIGSLTLRLEARPPEAQKKDDGDKGCQAAAGERNLWGLALLGLFFGLRLPRKTRRS